MWRACFRFGALGCVATVACLSGSGHDTLENRGGSSELTGAYWCSIQSGNYKYQRFPCVIRKFDDRFVLAKLGGSQRFEGEVSPMGRGFSFTGRFFCPYGDCSQALNGRFEPAERGALRGSFDDAKFTVELVRAPDSAYGGISYGGDEYGGFSYGGRGYGLTVRPPRNRHK